MIKLNLGCGGHILGTYINIDREESQGVTKGDIVTLEGWEDSNVDFIYAAHCLQCIPPRSLVPEALKNWYRVLKDDGMIIIEVPDVFPLIGKFLSKEVRLETLIKGIYGVDDDKNRQTIFFTYEYLERLLNEVGFYHVIKIPQPDYSVHDRSTNLVVEACK